MSPNTAAPRRYKQHAPEGCVRVSPAAESLQVSRQRVLQMLEDGILSGVQPNGPGTLWFIHLRSIDAAIRRAKDETPCPKESHQAS